MPVPRTGTPTDSDPVVIFMAAQPGLVDRLLAEHTDDGGGHCRVCTSGAQAGRKRWPCPLHHYAVRASVVTRS